VNEGSFVRLKEHCGKIVEDQNHERVHWDPKGINNNKNTFIETEIVIQDDTEDVQLYLNNDQVSE
jgi:hypothetical protein